MFLSFMIGQKMEFYFLTKFIEYFNLFSPITMLGDMDGTLIIGDRKIEPVYMYQIKNNQSLWKLLLN